MLTHLLLAAALQVTAQSRSMQPGKLVILTIVSPRARTLRVRAFDRDVSSFATDAHRWRALVGIDLDVKAGTYPVTVVGDDGESAVYNLIVRPRKFPTRRLTIDSAFVTPPESERTRIEREAALLVATFNHSTEERLWSGAFVRPVSGAANSAFGTRSIFNGQARNPHGGADFMSAAGTPIHAPNSGRIVVARNLYYSGNTVIIDHGLQLFSMLAHLSAFDVHEGDAVLAGQIVGRVGATGRVTGPHLHWAVRVGAARVDPLSLVALLGS